MEQTRWEREAAIDKRMRIERKKLEKQLRDYENLNHKREFAEPSDDKLAMLADKWCRRMMVKA